MMLKRFTKYAGLAAIGFSIPTLHNNTYHIEAYPLLIGLMIAATGVFYLMTGIVYRLINYSKYINYCRNKKVSYHNYFLTKHIFVQDLSLIIYFSGAALCVHQYPKVIILILLIYTPFYLLSIADSIFEGEIPPSSKNIFICNKSFLRKKI